MNKKEVVDEVMRLLQITDEKYRKRAESLYEKHKDKYDAEDLIYVIADEL
jgi:hypothetical protein